MIATDPDEGYHVIAADRSDYYKQVGTQARLSQVSTSVEGET